MALNVDLRVLTQPGATGNQTISLAADFDPKAIILWTSALAAAGSKVHAQFGIGLGTDRGGTAAQGTASIDARDAATSGDVASEMDTTALLSILTAASPGSRDLEIDLVSMQGGATSEVVINWVNLHGTASVKVNCLILGGSDITDALVGSFTRTSGVSSQDVTIASGFGQPDLLFMLASWQAIGDGIGVHGCLSLGFAKKGEAGRLLMHASRDANTTMFVWSSQRSDLLSRLVDPATGTIAHDFSLDTNPATNWPTDGFQINYGTQEGGATEENIYLALKGTFTVTTGNGTVPTAGGLPVVQDLNHGSVPKLGFIMGRNLAAATTVDGTSADLGAFFVGAGNGTVECVAGLVDDDAAGTSACDSFWTDQKVARNYAQGAAPALQSEADGSISGNNFRLSWNDIDTVAREYQWLTLGDAPAAGGDRPRLVGGRLANRGLLLEGLAS